MSKLTFFRNKKQSIQKLVTNNSKIVENYFFMTFVQIMGSLIGILIYPYLIRNLGANSYGLYVFAFSFINYFLKIVSFGFSLPALKIISQNSENQELKSDVVSSVISAKCYLALISTILFFISIYTIPFLYQNKWVYIICFTQIVSEIIFPSWYFQAVQKMRIIAFYQLGFRILSLPFIFIFVKETSDVLIYAIISTLSSIFVAVFSLSYLKFNENISFYFVPFNLLKTYFRDALPFFWSSSASVIKTESITTIIGIFFNMSDVAQYDLANKILQLPRIITSSINDSIFPKIIKDTQQTVVKKIIQYEIILGLGVILCIIIFGRWIVLLLGGPVMLAAYPLTVILSATILLNLVIGCYYNFIFVPNYRYYFITRNQFVAFISFFGFCISGLLFFQNILVLVAALVLSGCCEIVYCNYLITKHKLV